MQGPALNTVFLAEDENFLIGTEFGSRTCSQQKRNLFCFRFFLLLLPRSRAQLFFSSPFLFSRSESFKADDDDSDKKGHSRQLFRSNTETGLPDGIFSNQKY
jgi:hypothetical protein